MLYIVTALKPEAQAFIDRYKLKKTQLSRFKLFYNDTMRIIVSGIGVDNAAHATQTFINHYDITDDDIYLNVGVCGASKSHPIGSLLEIGAIKQHAKHYDLQSNSPLSLTCVDEEVKDATHDIVDMESFGFYDAVIHSPAIKNYHILKVVSDHFEPHTITKEMTKSLLFNVIDDINLILNSKGQR